jgi:hypothetical protein
MATHTFLYDDACPMCKGYTSVFEIMRWSKRRGFSTIKAVDIPGLDLDRGRHEIPLVDTETGEVRYGLDAMTTVLAEGMPLLRPVLRHAWLTAILKPLYWLITYNRRVIAGTKPPAEGFDCAPDYHLGWRVTYLAVAALLIVVIGLPPAIMLAGFGLATVAGLALHTDRIEFLGHLLTVILAASILLAILPGWIGLGAAYLFATWEGWRRLP